MSISSRGLDAIKRHEALRLHAYLDIAGVPTIGYGHTSGVAMGQSITEAQAEDYLRADLRWVESCIAECVTVPLSQGQYDALASLIFNIGAGAFKGSTLLRFLNDGDYAGAADQFLRWNKARVNGELREVEGLKTRRANERATFLADTGPSVHLGPEAAAEPAPAPPRPDQEPYTQPEKRMLTLPAIVAAVLPTVIEYIPKLGGLFGSGSKVSERNVAAATAVVEIVKTATGAVNAQDAAEKLKTDPAAVVAATKAVEAHWFELVEAGGGGIDGARKADAKFLAAGGWFWQSPSFWAFAFLAPLAYMVVGSIVGLWGSAVWSDDVRAAIATAVVSLIVGGATGYYWGSSTTRNRGAPPGQT